MRGRRPSNPFSPRASALSDQAEKAKKVRRLAQSPWWTSRTQVRGSVRRVVRKRYARAESYAQSDRFVCVWTATRLTVLQTFYFVRKIANVALNINGAFWGGFLEGL